VWSLAVLIGTGVALTGFFRQAALERFQEGVFDVAEGLFAGATVRRSDGAVLAPPLTDSRATRVFSGKYWQIAEPTPKGIHPLIRSRSLWDKALPGPPGGLEPLAAVLGKPIYYNTPGPAGEPLRAAAIMALLPGRTEPLIFMAAQDRQPVDDAANRFAVLTAFALVALGVGLVLAVVLQVRLGLAPLFDLGREIADVRKGKALRLSARYPTEIAPLAQEMNALLDHNQEVVERQRTHVGNLAHALKTPLAVITGEAEADKTELAALVTRQAVVMQGQIDHHLRRARAAARAQALGERTLVEPALDELAGMLERVFQDKGVEIDWRAPETLCFLGERQDLLEIMGNLLENACKWSKRRVWVVAEAVDAGQMRLSVEDDGPGLPDERRDEVLKRGARLDESAPGSGLGLSIVDELVRAYGGRMELSRGKLGGLKVDLWLPVAEH
jgi:signal transduction histidine kinase